MRQVRGMVAGAMLAGAMSVGAARADDDCTVPMADWQPRAAVEAEAGSRGWTIRRLGIDDGCYEIDGWDREGREVEIKLDPASLAIVDFEYEDDRPGAERKKGEGK